jgi:glutamate synthase domain-containing protein 2
MRRDKDKMLKMLESSARTGDPSLRPGGAKRDMVDFDDLVVVPNEGIKAPAGEIGTDVTIGIKRYTNHPIELQVPLYISDITYGEVGRTAKASLMYGATMAKTMVMSGHGRLLHEEREIVDELDGLVVAKWSRDRHGIDIDQLEFCNGVCIDLAQGPKVIVPANIVTKEVAENFDVQRGMEVSQPRAHLDLRDDDDLMHHINMLREALQYEVPVMVKVSGGDVYEKVRSSIEAGADAVVLEGMHAWRARGTEAMSEHMGEPLVGMIPAAVRAFIDTKAKNRGVKLLVQGGILSGADAFKAMAMGADAVGLDCAALVGIGCKLLGACHTNKCPQGIATIDPKLEAKVSFKMAGKNLGNLIQALVTEMSSLADAAGLNHLSASSMRNLRALTYDAAAVTGTRLLGLDRSLPLWLQ